MDKKNFCLAFAGVCGSYVCINIILSLALTQALSDPCSSANSVCHAGYVTGYIISVVGLLCFFTAAVASYRNLNNFNDERLFWKCFYILVFCPISLIIISGCLLVKSCCARHTDRNEYGRITRGYVPDYGNITHG